GKLLTKAEQPREQHEGEANTAVEEAGNTSSPRALRRPKAVGYVGRNRDCQNGRTAKKPSAVCVVDEHWPNPLPRRTASPARQRILVDSHDAPHRGDRRRRNWALRDRGRDRRM